MTQQTKNLEERLIQSLSKEIVLSSYQEKKIRYIIKCAFREGYGDCLKDVREGLIK